MGIRGISDTAAEVQKQKVEVIVEQMSAISSIFQSDAIEVSEIYANVLLPLAYVKLPLSF